MKILVVTPIVGKNLHSAEIFQSMVSPGTTVIQTTLDCRPVSIESEFDEMLAVSDTVAKIMQGEADGVDAAFIDCMGDPGLKPAREVVRIPVVGPYEASIHFAAMLGFKFSVMTVLDAAIPMFWDNTKIYGVAEKLALVRSVDISVLDFDQNPVAMVQALVREFSRTVCEDAAHVIIFGCTGMTQQVQTGLTSSGFNVRMVDPVEAGMRTAETWVRLDISQSKHTYAYPPIRVTSRCRAKPLFGRSDDRLTTGETT